MIRKINIYGKPNWSYGLDKLFIWTWSNSNLTIKLQLNPIQQPKTSSRVNFIKFVGSIQTQDPSTKYFLL